jgi:HAD superfamily hydrolase (TIGR01509 family)
LVQAILWDMDGVLVDSGEAHHNAWKLLYAERSQEITYEDFAATFGMANPFIIRRWLGQDTSDEVVQAVAERKEQIFRTQVRSHVHLLPGVRDWLEHFRRSGYRQAVASSGEMANVVAIVSAMGVGNYFDALVSGAFLPRSKPDPAIFLAAAAAVGALPAECLVLEDSTAGVEAARRAGMRCIALTTTNPRDKLGQADLVVDSLEELEKEAVARLLRATTPQV